MTTNFLYMEDCTVGDTFTAGPVTITAQDIIAFATQFDPQDFHTDTERAKDTAFGQLVASGWHTASITMKMVVDAIPKMKGGMIGRTVLNMNWPRPVLPDDQLSYTAEILEIRRSSKNPKRGILKIKNTTTNQHGDTVLEMDTIVMIPCRGD